MAVRGTRAVVVTTLSLCLAISSPRPASDHPRLASAPTWTAMGTPAVSSGVGGVELTAISCVAPYDCIAVGDAHLAATSAVPIAEHLDGGVWSMLGQPPSPHGATEAGLLDVSCVGPSSCVAVGSSNAGAFQRPMAEQFDGSSWSIVPTPHPGGTDSVLTSVSCTSRSFCVAVGSGVSNPTQLFAEVYDGSRWSLSRAIIPRHSEESWLSGVSCRTRSCYAVGSVALGLDTEGFDFRSLIERYRSGRWSVVHTIDPPGSLESMLATVSCLRSTECVAVGNTYEATSGVYLTYSLSGSTWTSTARDEPSGDVPEQIRCRQPDACVAVGTFVSTASSALVSAPVVENFNGTSWVAANVPSGLPGSLLGVACFVPACVAVGGNGTSRALALIS